MNSLCIWNRSLNLWYIKKSAIYCKILIALQKLIIAYIVSTSVSTVFIYHILTHQNVCNLFEDIYINIFKYIIFIYDCEWKGNNCFRGLFFKLFIKCHQNVCNNRQRKILPASWRMTRNYVNIFLIGKDWYSSKSNKTMF